MRFCIAFALIAGALFAGIHFTLQLGGTGKASSAGTWNREKHRVAEREELSPLSVAVTSTLSNLPTHTPHLDLPTEPPPVAHTTTRSEAVITPFSGKNLIFAGDSNDRNFIDFLCKILTHKFDGKTYVQKVRIDDQDGQYTGRNITWPVQSASAFCHDKGRNASALLLFHLGLWSIEPRPRYHKILMENRSATHGIGGMKGVMSSVDLAKHVWPHVVLKHLPQRPIVLVIQSSLWDAVSIIEDLVKKRISSMSDADTKKQLAVSLSESNLTEWGWLQRASSLISGFLEGAHSHGLNVERIFWRTNPNCPFLLKEGSHIMNLMSDLQSQIVHKAVAQRLPPWDRISIVDWRSHLSIRNTSQCDKHHYKKEGYAAYLEALRTRVAI